MLAAVAMLLALTSCMDNLQPETAPDQDNTYTISVEVTKSASTKGLALSGDGKSILATWDEDDKVYVYNVTKNQNLTGYLQPASWGADVTHTILQGTVTGVIEINDRLRLTLNSDAYDAQDGTLEYIADHCDLAQGDVIINAIDASNNVSISGSANLPSKQSIVRFTMKNGESYLNAEELVIIHLASSSNLFVGPDTAIVRIPASTYNTNGDGVVFVALPPTFNNSERGISLTATVNGQVYTFTKDKAGFNQGTYSHITVQMARNDEATPLTFEAKANNVNITFTACAGISFGEDDVEFRTEKSGIISNWEAYTSGTSVSLPNAGDKVMFRGSLDHYGTSSDGSKFSVSSSCYVYGNVMSLLRKTDYDELTELTQPYTFRALFYDNGLKLYSHDSKAILLPATTLTEGCYQAMFSGCMNLVAAPALPATTLTEGCYRAMFSNCLKLAAAPALPAMEMKRACYANMFYKCEALTKMPALPATTLAEQCYANMFKECKNLITLPESLPAMAMADSCYYYMFEECKNLTTVPSGFLPATTLAKSCYQYMFQNCNLLTTAPNLSAETVADYAYYDMFNNCYGNLTTTPTISATTLGVESCRGMFNNCKQLTTVSNFSATTLAHDCCRGMFSGCTSLTSLPSSLPATTLASNCYLDMFNGCTSLETIPTTFLPATGLAEHCYENMFKGCTSLKGSTATTSLPKLDATELKYECYFSMFEGCTSLTTVPTNYLPATALAGSCYSYMFKNCENLTNAPELPTTVINSSWSSCYGHMFYGCKALATVPELPATQLSNYCYDAMFYGCTSLTTIPDNLLQVTELKQACYRSMFSGCTSLTTAPALPATTLADYCYEGMFSDCTNLGTTPALQATTLKKSCYQNMFKNCKSLTTVQAIDATTLAESCCESMFEACTSLTAGPVLKATTLIKHCYWKMFYDCTKFESITCLASSIPSPVTDYTYCWLNNVKSSGTFTTPSGTNWTVDSNNGIPTGWTRVNYVAQ